jgi:hypothetical protein
MVAVSPYAEVPYGEGGLGAGPYPPTPNNQINIPYTNNYPSLVTQEFQTPIFLQLVKLYTDAIAQNTAILNMLPYLFSVDYAVGSQLDVTAKWIGVSRNLLTPITGTAFTWDTPGLGWDQGYWSDTGTGSGTIYELPDSVFRKLLYAEIGLNHWNGSIIGIYNTFNIVFPPSTGIHFIVIDNFDMTMSLDVFGPSNPILSSLINDGYFNIRPTGVLLNVNYINNPIFTWDKTNTYQQGWENGYWQS